MAKHDIVSQFMDHSVCLDTRTLSLIGEVDDIMLERAIKGLHLLRADNRLAPVTIYLSSEGGSWMSGIAIYSFIKQMPFYVTIEGHGCVMSMATVIFQAADKRALDPYCTFMIHHGTDQNEKQTAISYERWAECSKLNRHQMCAIYAGRTGQKPAYWQRKCQHDLIMTAEEAVAEGLADSLITT